MEGRRILRRLRFFMYTTLMKKESQHSTLYRAYRPQSFDEVRGQEQVVKVLEAAIKNKKIAHAYLFAGGRGTGKTSVARILAKNLGVDDKDLYEMDAASNRASTTFANCARACMRSI